MLSPREAIAARVDLPAVEAFIDEQLKTCDVTKEGVFKVPFFKLREKFSNKSGDELLRAVLQLYALDPYQAGGQTTDAMISAAGDAWSVSASRVAEGERGESKWLNFSIGWRS